MCKRIMPRIGGGALRRWYKIKKNQWKKYNVFSNEYIQYPITLFDFARIDDAADIMSLNTNLSNNSWRISDDGVINGYSTGTIECLKEYAERSKNNCSEIITFIRWSGNTDTKVGKKSFAKRSGYCALRSPPFPFGVSLDRNYNALEIVCRPDERTYTVNLKVNSYFPDDLYQGIFTSNESADNITLENLRDKNDYKHNQIKRFVSIILPFRNFLLTSSGLVREQQRYLDGNIVISHIGFIQMDGKNGPFQFDLKKVRAVSYEENRILS